MFTGLIEDVGRVGHVQESGSGFRLAVRSALAPELEPGDSLAVNGVCLTVTSAGDGTLQFDVGPETGRITTLGAWRPGQPVNLERAMRADGRFGGHFVQGHVDGIATVEQIRADGEAQWVGFSLPPALAAYVVQKGSIAIDGISLTIAGLDETTVQVMIVPFTWQHTNLSSRRAGDRVNVECDLIAKYVARAADVVRSVRL